MKHWYQSLATITLALPIAFAAPASAKPIDEGQGGSKDHKKLEEKIEKAKKILEVFQQVVKVTHPRRGNAVTTWRVEPLKGGFITVTNAGDCGRYTGVFGSKKYKYDYSHRLTVDGRTVADRQHPKKYPTSQRSRSWSFSKTVQIATADELKQAADAGRSTLKKRVSYTQTCRTHKSSKFRNRPATTTSTIEVDIPTQ